MPRMDGLTFLRKLMRYRPMPVVVISSLAQRSCRAAIEALELGAVEVLGKPGGPYSVGELRDTLAAKIRAAASSRIRQAPAPAGARSDPAPSPMTANATVPALGPLQQSNRVIASGASTGGTEAIAHVLRALPKDTPCVLVVQHIPPVFSRAFADRLNGMCAMDVKEAEDGDPLRAGLVLVAPGDLHLVLRKRGDEYFINVKSGPKVCYRGRRQIFCSSRWRKQPVRWQQRYCSPEWARMARKECLR